MKGFDGFGATVFLYRNMSKRRVQRSAGPSLFFPFHIIADVGTFSLPRSLKDNPPRTSGRRFSLNLYSSVGRTGRPFPFFDPLSFFERKNGFPPLLSSFFFFPPPPPLVFQKVVLFIPGYILFSSWKFRSTFPLLCGERGRGFGVFSRFFPLGSGVWPCSMFGFFREDIA